MRLKIIVVVVVVKWSPEDFIHPSGPKVGWKINAWWRPFDDLRTGRSTGTGDD